MGPHCATVRGDAPPQSAFGLAAVIRACSSRPLCRRPFLLPEWRPRRRWHLSTMPLRSAHGGPHAHPAQDHPCPAQQTRQDAQERCRDGAAGRFPRLRGHHHGREWPEHYPLETIKAGAIVTKQFAWYYVINRAAEEKAAQRHESLLRCRRYRSRSVLLPREVRRRQAQRARPQDPPGARCHLGADAAQVQPGKSIQQILPDRVPSRIDVGLWR